MRKMNKAALALVLATCGIVRAQATTPDVLEVLPANALVAGKVANLAATSKKLAQLFSQLGVDAFEPGLKDPLGTLKSKGHLDNGLNENGQIGFAFLDPKAAGGKPDDSFVFVVPVSDYDAFLTNFNVTDGATKQITPKDGGRPMFVGNWNGYAAISPTEALVAKPAETIKPVPAAAKESAKQDFLIVANFAELGPTLMPQLDKGVAEFEKQFEKAGGKDLDPKYKPLVKVGVNQLFNAAKTFLNSTDAATVGLNVSDAGLNFTVLSSFKAESYLGKMATDFKGTEKPLTVGLPAMKYLVYGGSALAPAVTSRLFDDLFGPVLAEVEKLEGIPEAKKLVGEAKAAVNKSTGATFGMPAPQKVGEEGILQQVVVYRGGGPEFKTLFTDGFSFGKQIVTDLKLPEGQPKPTIETAVNDKAVEGVNFDSVKIDLPPNPNDPMAQMQAQMQKIMYGPNGLSYHYGTLNDDLILSNGASDETLAAFIKSVKAGEDSISKTDPFKAVAGELPKVRVVEYYVQLDEIVNTGVQTAAQFGFPVQVQLPPDLPPLGMTFGGDGTSLRFDAHLPTSTVQALIAAGMQAFMGMRGGGNL